MIKGISRYRDDGLSVAEALKRIGNSHTFETTLADLCKSKRLRKIVRALSHGEISIDVPPLGEIGFPYVIFELGDGDTHAILKDNPIFDYIWWFDKMHQAAVGINQLHSIGVAHQDLKPSNLVFFGIDSAKLADLGRASFESISSPNDDRIGDFSYAPPEYYFNHTPVNRDLSCIAIDLYLLGSLAFSGVSGSPMTSALLLRLPPSFSPGVYSGDYDNVVPVLRKTLVEVLDDASKTLPTQVREKFISTISYLCDPAPANRGHPKNHLGLGSNLSMERFISSFRSMVLTLKISS